MTPEQCEHCVCLCEEAEGVWYCDQYDKPITEIEKCGEQED